MDDMFGSIWKSRVLLEESEIDDYWGVWLELVRVIDKNRKQ